MEVGERITFPFGKGEREGTVKRIMGKTVYLVADFPRHKGKIIKRSVHELDKGKKKKTSTRTKSKKAE